MTTAVSSPVGGGKRSIRRRWAERAGQRFLARPVLGVFLLALGVRLVAVIAVTVAGDGDIFPDDTGYLLSITRYAAGMEPGGWWDDFPAFFRPLGWLAAATTADPLILLSVGAVAGSLTAAAVTFILLDRVSTPVAAIAGLVVALTPSQILWSSLLLRDPYMWMALSAIAVALTIAFSDRWRVLRVAAIVAIPLLWWYVSDSRLHTAGVTVIATVAALVLALPRGRLAVGGALVAIAAVVVIADLGPGRLDLITRSTAGLEAARAEEQAEAATTIDCIELPIVGAGDPLGAGWANDLRCLPSGLRMMIADPLPSDLDRSPSLIPAFAEHLIWYPLVALAGLGLWRTRRWSPAITYVALSAIGLVIMWALIDRNLGTAFRHRGEFFWSTAVLAGLGLQSILDQRARASTSET